MKVTFKNQMDQVDKRMGEKKEISDVFDFLKFFPLLSTFVLVPNFLKNKVFLC